MIQTNKIYKMEAIELLKQLQDNSVDLVLTDPPYGTNADKKFNIKWKNKDEYLSVIKNLAEQTKRCLKETGCFYLMCDKNLSHYIKIILDDVFGENNFRSEIIWDSSIPYSAGYKWMANNWIYSQIRIFYYVKSNKFIFNKQTFEVKQPSGDISDKPLKDVWTDIKNFAGFLGTKEKSTGVPTQKPIEIMERIIKASSNKGDLVVDCFVGSGTTAVASKKLNRNFICCDINEDYVKIAESRLSEIGETQTKISNEIFPSESLICVKEEFQK